MIQVSQSGEVRVFRMARSLFGRALYFTAAYWVDGLMIDTGCSYTEGELLSTLEGLPVDVVVNTHSHEDHVGGNGVIQGRFGARVLIHPSGLPLLAAPRTSMVLRPYQKVMWGYPAPSEAHPIGERVETRHHVFEVIHTPGHSPDHVSLHEPRQGWLFCGDAYVGGRDRALRADYNIWQIIASLKKMAGLDVEWLFPGSGKVREKAHGEIAEKILYLEETAEKVLALHRRGWGYRRIRRRLFGKESGIAYVTLGNFSGKHLVRSFVEDRPNP
jgi:glyoxylase-like metal-dependent hydrolase (beta-lactamase superfamily II)